MFHYAKKQGGIILILVLVFMPLIVMLSWCALANVMLAMQASQIVNQRNQSFNAALGVLHQLEAQLVSEIPHCIVPQAEASQLIAKSLAWWQSAETCAGNFQGFKYYYVVEPLGDDSCASIENIQATAAYFRITLFLNANSDAKIFLQSTVIRASDWQQLCQGTHHLVKLGRQAWSELD
jgi:Tfp pilus assembly protein PilX